MFSLDFAKTTMPMKMTAMRRTAVMVIFTAELMPAGPLSLVLPEIMVEGPAGAAPRTPAGAPGTSAGVAGPPEKLIWPGAEADATG